MAWDCIESRTLVPGCKCKSLVSCTKSVISDDQANSLEIGERKKFKTRSASRYLQNQWPGNLKSRVDSKVVKIIFVDFSWKVCWKKEMEFLILWWRSCNLCGSWFMMRLDSNHFPELENITQFKFQFICLFIYLWQLIYGETRFQPFSRVGKYISI